MRNGGLNETEMWCERRMEKISRNDHVRNEEVLKKSRRREYSTNSNRKED
jgi:hypothetical protein